MTERVTALDRAQPRPDPDRIEKRFWLRRWRKRVHRQRLKPLRRSQNPAESV